MKENMVLISVIVPIYNSEIYLKECIESILNQTYSSLEVLLINDGSTDKSLELCEEYAKNDKRIKVINKSNEGVSVARNVGIDNARGKWIAFIDSDDWLEKNMFEEMLNRCENKNIDIAMCNCFMHKNNQQFKNKFLCDEDTIFDKEGIRVFQNKFLCSGVKMYKPYVWGIGTPWCKLYNAELIKKNNIRFVPGLTRNEDGLFNLYALEYSKKIMYISECYYNYRVLEGSLSHKRNKNIIEDTEKNLHELISFSKKFNKDDIFINGVYSRIITATQQYLKDLYFYKFSFKLYRKGKKELLELMNRKMYSDACNKFKYNTMNISEKIYCFCFKHKLIMLLFLMVKVRNKIKK